MPGDCIQSLLTGATELAFVLVEDAVLAANVVDRLLTTRLRTIEIISAADVAVFLIGVSSVFTDPILVSVQTKATGLTETVIDVSVSGTEDF